MVKEKILVYLPNLEPAPGLDELLEASGVIPVYDLAMGRAADFENLLGAAGRPKVVRIDVFTDTVYGIVRNYADRIRLLILDIRHPEQLGKERFAEIESPYAFEVYNVRDVLSAHAYRPVFIIGRGYEGSGVVSCHTSLVLHQVLRRKSHIPYFIKGGVDIPAIPALLRSGADGVVLDSSLWMFEEFRFQRSAELGRIGETDTLILDDGTGRQFRFFAKTYSLEARYLREISYSEPGNFSRRLKMLSKDLLIVGLDAFWAGRNFERYGSLESCLSHLAASVNAPGAYRNYLAPGEGVCKTVGTAYPIFQGPMARISENIKWSSAIARAGALPFIALSRLDGNSTRNLLKEAVDKGLLYGVGLMGINFDQDVLEEQLAVLDEYKPAFAVVAAPNPDLVARLESNGTVVYVHTPTIGSFKTFFDLGYRRFILEGCEAGGHIGVESSLVLWQNILGELKGLAPAGGVEIVLAGGVVDCTAVRFINGLIDAYGLGSCCRFGVQIGTAYLATGEIVSSGAVSRNYQRMVIEASETIITGDTLNLRVRQVKTEYARRIVKKERELVRRGLPLHQRKEQFERENIGNLSKAVFSKDGEEEGSFMAGDALVLLDKVRSTARLHEDLCSLRPVSTGIIRAERDGADEAIAVIGASCIVPDARNPVEFFENLLNKKVSIREVPRDYWNPDIFYSEDRDKPLHTYSKIGAFVGDVEFPNLRYKIPPRVAIQMDKAQKWALICARRALEDAGYGDGEFDRRNTAVIVANSMGGELNLRNIKAVDLLEFKFALRKALKDKGRDVADLEELEAAIDEMIEPVQINEDTLPGELSNVIAGRIAACFDLGGANYTVDAACASSLAALLNAVTGLRQRQYDMVITGGVDTQMGPSSFVKFSKVGALSNEGSFPFDQRASGFVMGEGCVLFVLKRYNDALAAGDRIYGLIQSVGYSSDGRGKAIAAPNPDGQCLAFQRAYRAAGVRAGDVDFVEMHGTGTVAGDPVEMETVRRIFSARGSDSPVTIGSVKANIGHLRAASGAVGLLKVLLCVNQRVVPPQASYETPHESFRPGHDPFTVNRELVEIDRSPFRAGVSSFGFGGTNFHVLVQEPALNRKELKIRYPRPRFARSVPSRRLARAFVFPGQSAQYVNMFEELRDTPAFREFLERADKVYLANYGETLSDYIYPSPEVIADQARLEHRQLLLQNTIVAQPAILTVSAALLRILRERGIEADMAFGHSLGEYTALYAAGVISFEDVIDAVTIRGKYMTALAGDDLGAMAFIAADKDTVEEILEKIGGYVVCANINSPTQTIISGASDAVDEAVRLFDAAGFVTRPLPVSAAFHSEIVKRAAPLFRKGLGKYSFHKARLPVSSNLDTRFYPMEGDDTISDSDAAEAIRDRLTHHIYAPVDFIRQIHRAYELGIRTFIEVGPKNILTRLIDANLPDRPINTFYTNHPKENTVELVEELEAELKKKVFIRPGVSVPQVAQASPSPLSPADKAAMAVPLSGPRAAPSAASGDTVHFAADTQTAGIGKDTSSSAATGGADGSGAPGLGGGGLPGESSSLVSEEEREAIVSTVRSVVADVSGYPEDMLERDADFEGDLGIDTIKIFEVFTKLREYYPQAKGKRRNLSKLTTIDKVTDYLVGVIVEQPGTEASTAGRPAAKSAPTGGSREPVRAAPTDQGVVSAHRLIPYLALAGAEGTSFLDGPPRKILVKAIDDDDFMERLRLNLEEAGHEVEFFSPGGCSFDEAGVEALSSRHSSPGVYIHLVSTGRLDIESNWYAVHKAEIASLYLVAKAFADSLTHCLVITDVDGGMGLWDVLNNPETGRPSPVAFVPAALTSLALSLAKDIEGLKVKTVDIKGFGDRVDIGRLWSEIDFSAAHPIEGLADRNSRVRLSLVPESEKRPESPRNLVTEDTTIVVTGGARGLGLLMVERLAREHGPRVLVLGRSSEPGEGLASVKGFGEKVSYASCDVCDAEAVSLAISGLLEERGAIDVLIHCAGIEVSRSLGKKSPEEFLSVYRVKVDGLRNVLRACGENPPGAIVNFSSVAGLFGNYGQVDYAAANGFLSFYAPAGDIRLLSIAWAAWSEVGMASRGPVKEILEGSGVSLIDPATGGDFFFSQLYRLLAESRCFKVVGFYGELGDGYADPPYPPVDTEAAVRVFSLEDSPYLEDHTIGGRCFLPAVVGLGQFIGAVEEPGDRNYVLEDIEFVSPVKLGRKRGVTTRVVKEEKRMTFVSQRELPSGEKRSTANFRCSIDKNLDLAAQLRRDSTELSRMKGIMEPVEFPVPLSLRPVSRDEIYSFFFHGPNFRVLKAFNGGNLHAFSCEVDFGPMSLPGNGLSVPRGVPFLIEAALHTCGLHCLCTVASPNYVLPAACDRIVIRYDALEHCTGARIYTSFLERGYRRLERFTLRTKCYNSVVLNQEGEPVIALYGIKMIEGQDQPERKDRFIITGVPFEIRDVPSCVVETGDVEKLLPDKDGLALVLGPAELELFEKLSGKRALQWLAGRIASKLLVRDHLRLKAGAELDLHEVEVSSGGAPPSVSVKDATGVVGAALTDLRLSISHCDRYAAAIIDDSARGVGVDVELVRELDDAMVKDFTSAREYDLCPGKIERVGLWTLKEACVKATGEGMSRELADFTLESFDFNGKVTLTDRVSGRRFDGLSIFDGDYCLSTVRELVER